MDELEFVKKLQSRFPPRPPVETGIGDDGAVLRCSPGEQMVVVTDMLLDGVDFELQRCSPRLIGRKAIAVNLSDLAAMGCHPTAAFVSLAVPRTFGAAEGADFLDELYAGMEELFKRYDFTLAGGDTNSWHGPFVVNVCLTGTPYSTSPVFRSGAKTGDTLLVTGPLGGSLHSGRHLTFEPRLDAAEWLCRNADVHAMMDLSDGLSIDLHRLMESSRSTAQVESTLIPVHPDVSRELSSEKRLDAALNDGEDFELLLSVAAVDVEPLLASARNVGLTLIPIGAVNNDACSTLALPDGSLVPLRPRGWQYQL